MAASSAESGKGVTLTWDDDLVSEVTNDLGVSPKREMIDVTNHDSDDDYSEFIPGLKDGGEIKVECNSVPADTGQAGVYTDFEAGGKKAFVITFPDTGAGAWTGYGYISDLEMVCPTKGQVKLHFTVKVTGKPTWTP